MCPSAQEERARKKQEWGAPTFTTHTRTFEGGFKEGGGEAQGGDEEGEGAVELHRAGLTKSRAGLWWRVPVRVVVGDGECGEQGCGNERRESGGKLCGVKEKATGREATTSGCGGTQTMCKGTRGPGLQHTHVLPCLHQQTLGDVANVMRWSPGWTGEKRESEREPQHAQGPSRTAGQATQAAGGGRPGEGKSCAPLPWLHTTARGGGGGVPSAVAGR